MLLCVKNIFILVYNALPYKQYNNKTQYYSYNLLLLHKTVFVIYIYILYTSYDIP